MGCIIAIDGCGAAPGGFLRADGGNCSSERQAGAGSVPSQLSHLPLRKMIASSAKHGRWTRLEENISTTT